MGLEPGVDWRAKWPDLDLEEKVKIIKFFDRFPTLFLMALRDVISGLLIRDQIKPNQTHYGIGTQWPPCMAFPYTVAPLYGILFYFSWGEPI